MIFEGIKAANEKNKTLFAVLIDPEKVTQSYLKSIGDLLQYAEIDFFFVGGSLLSWEQLQFTLTELKKITELPLVLFPGSANHISESADALLFLNLISGRNSEYLIGQQLQAAPKLKKSQLEILSTGYMLIDQRNQSAVSYVSNTTPIPHNQYELARQTAYAGQLMGNKLIYMDAGSGATYPISPRMISKVKTYIDIPLIIGGGIKNPNLALSAADAGADVVVVGNSIEKEPVLLAEIADALKTKRIA